MGDVCASDDDNDGILDIEDNCQFAANPGQENNDGGLDIEDNCQFVANPGQENIDHDSIGDACDNCICVGFCDLNGDGTINPGDVVTIVNFVYKGVDQRVPKPTCPKENGDWDCDGVVNPIDVVSYINYVYKQSGAPCDPCAP